jgi:Na+/proline symporter
MRFVQFYLGLPIAMVILSATAVPIFHRANVYTAYEYLEYRFDSRTRLLVTIVFLIQRGLAAGLGLSAPAIVMGVILGWPFHVTIVIMGGLVVLFTTLGGIKAVTWADVLQMTVIMSALVLALIIGVRSMPADISFVDAIKLAGAAGRLNAITTHLDWNDRYNLWSGLIGGTCLMLAYFGCDQSQVQRYLAGKSIAQSRISLLFNAMAKVPVQFFILFIGAMVFVFFLFERPPLLFHPAELQRVQQSSEYPGIEARYEQAFEQRRTAARALNQAGKIAGDSTARASALASFQAAQKEMDQARATAMRLTQESDTNYIFLSFVTHYLPAGLVGLIIAVIFTAAMVSIAGEINSLATVTLIDIYRRYLHREGTDAHYLGFSRWATVFWGIYAVVFAGTARGFGALIEAVNQVGSLFYGGLLGVFVLAFFLKGVGARGAFYGVLAGEASIFAAARFTNIAFLWYTVIGAAVVVAVGWCTPEPTKA